MKDINDINIPANDKRLIMDVMKTRNVPTLTLLVKASIFRRDSLLGKDPGAAEYKFDRIGEVKVRARAQKLVAAILKVSDRKSISLLCGTAIAQRHAARSKGR